MPEARNWTWASFMEAFGQELTNLYEGKRVRADMSSLYRRHRLPAPKLTRGETVVFKLAEDPDTEIAAGVTVGMLTPEARTKRDEDRLLAERKEKYDWLHRHSTDRDMNSDELNAALERLGFPVPTTETHVVADVYFTADAAKTVDFTLPEKVKQDDVLARLEEHAQDPQEVTLAQQAFPNAKTNGVKRVRIRTCDVRDSWKPQSKITAQGFKE